MKFFILTDLEGIAGVDNFTQTRAKDTPPKNAAMRRLAVEVNSCIDGIHSVYPDAVIDVWDGHGPSGLFPEDLKDGNYLREGKPYYHLEGYDAMLFVGQHAMAGTFNAPLNHTYSSLHVAYFRLNQTFIGEFGARALIAGLQGVPTIFISGDDKAILEAQLFIPEIETVIVKYGKGLEAAEHLSGDMACQLIKEGAARAVQRLREIAPFIAIQAPYELEIRYYHPQDQKKDEALNKSWLDDRTFVLSSNDLADFPF